ncbi:MAG: hypothetical protein R3F61_26135 [Myxococcota bacterium]
MFLLFTAAFAAPEAPPPPAEPSTEAPGPSADTPSETPADAGSSRPPREIPTASTEPVEIDKSSLRVFTRVMPMYPEAVLGGDLACDAQLIIEMDGKVSSVEVQPGCTAPFDQATKTAFSQWMYEPPESSGQVVRARTVVRTIFEASEGSFVDTMSPEEFNATVRAHTLLEPREEGRCIVQSTVHASGQVTDLASKDPQTCLLVPVGAKTPKSMWKEMAEPQTCQLTFKSQDGAKVGLKFEACDPELQAATEKMLAKWRFNDTKKGVYYDLTLTFDPR